MKFLLYQLLISEYEYRSRPILMRSRYKLRSFLVTKLTGLLFRGYPLLFRGYILLFRGYPLLFRGYSRLSLEEKLFSLEEKAFSPEEEPFSSEEIGASKDIYVTSQFMFYYDLVFPKRSYASLPIFVLAKITVRINGTTIAISMATVNISMCGT